MPIHLWLPESGRGPGIVLFQEIFGVGPFIESVARKLSGLGYVVGAPEMFWRFAPGFEAAHDEQGMREAMGAAGRLDPALAGLDAAAAVDHLRGLPEVDGGVAAMGYCLGGTLAFAAGIEGRPDAVVSYYGSMVPQLIGSLDQVTCPILFHFGTEDRFLPVEQVQKVEQAVNDSRRDDIELDLQPAGHAWENAEAPMFHDPDATAASWAITVDFLGRRLPTAAD
ncbi:MAG: dienelactone hydrolase family protein [Actinobacteria bacterium]|nr:dienelactone hydrolase family protein [Actinomycetota bacterium]